MQTRTLELPGLHLIEPKRFGDERGFLSDRVRAAKFETGIRATPLVQENHSYSKNKGTVRGLHYQRTPHAQGKLVRVARGAIFDVAVDIRRSSLTYGKHVSAVLSAENWSQLWLPPGFAHGFCTLESNCEVTYKVTDFYSREHDLGLAWDDPALGIPWPVTSDSAILSDKDRAHPLLKDLPAYFV